MVSQAGVALVSSFVVILGAGFPLTFSLYATSFQSVLGFSQTQVNTVNICNIIGQFICYPVIGALSDKYGANVVASLGAVFIIPGLLSAAVAYENRYSCAFLSTMFFFIGMGSTCGYITAVSTSARSLPNQKGLAISIPVCAYGLATLIYSVIFSQFFKTSQGYDIPAFWRSITIFVAFASIIGFFGMRVVVPSPTPQSRESDPLLQQQQQQDQYHGPEDAENSEGSAPLHRPPFFKDVTVVLYAIGYVLIAGSAETLVGNMGSILASIDASSQQPSQASTAVSLFAVFSTLSRLLIGWLSDALANKGLSRMTIPVFMVAVPMAIDFLALSLLPSTQTSFLIIVSINGFCYGSLYSSGPTIAAVVWGLDDFGRNWGVLSYSPLLGSVLGSYLYAVLYDRHASQDDGLCLGKSCFGASMFILSICIAIGAGFWASAWRIWARRNIKV